MTYEYDKMNKPDWSVANYLPVKVEIEYESEGKPYKVVVREMTFETASKAKWPPIEFATKELRVTVGKYTVVLDDWGPADRVLDAGGEFALYIRPRKPAVIDTFEASWEALRDLPKS